MIAFIRARLDYIGSDIISEVKDFFYHGRLDQSHNHTNMCLNSKVEALMSMSEFIPIALCNVYYMIISKILFLVNRLKKQLSSFIIPGRMITNNIIIAHEFYHSLKARKRQVKSYMALKTDITKAYDKIQWKSAITFGDNIRCEVKRRKRHILGIHNEGGCGKYLGLPEQVGSKKIEMKK